MTSDTISALLAQRRADSCDRECLVADEQRMTYGQLEEQSERFARQLLAAGVSFGTRIGILLPNRPEFVVSWTAIARIGAVAVPISTLSTPAELRRICRHANLHLLVSSATYLHHSFVDLIANALGGLDQERPPYRLATLPRLRSVWMWGEGVPGWSEPIDLDVEPDISAEVLAAVEYDVTAGDVASIIYTSGSTADPKGVMHTHGSLMRAARKCRDSYDQRADDRLFTQMPFFWVGGLTVNLLAAMSAGATQLTCSSSAASAVLEFLERERATSVTAWPHLARSIAADPTFSVRDLSSVRMGGLHEALPPSARPIDPTLMNSALGMTETAGPHTVASLAELPEERRGSFGPPQPGMAHRVVDPATGRPVAAAEVGDLLVRGDTRMAGLVRRERHETFDDDGWYRTGDLVSIRDGHLHFHGRLDDLIKTAGANVSPREVEEVLTRLPGVLAAVVTSVDGGERGDVVGAVLVVSDPGFDVDAIRAAAKLELSSYKVPRVIVILGPDEVPLMSSGKVNRLALIERLRRREAPFSP